MRGLPRVAVVLAAVSVVGCERSTPVQPGQQDATVAFGGISAAAAAASAGSRRSIPRTRTARRFYMIGPHLFRTRRQCRTRTRMRRSSTWSRIRKRRSRRGSRADYAAIRVPAAMQPVLSPRTARAFVYHDHVITGAPGMGSTHGGRIQGPMEDHRPRL